MNDFKHISDLLSGFFSGTLTPEEKGDLYHYVIDDSHKNEIMAWLQEQWNHPLWQIDGEMSSEALFAKIRTEIEKQATVSAHQSQGRKIHISQKPFARNNQPAARRQSLSKIENQKSKTFLRYAAVFMVAFGLSWAVQKTTISQTIAAVAETSPQYNEIWVPFGSKTKVILPDSSTVWLNAGTRLKYPAHFDGSTRHVFLQGEGFFDVTEDSQHPFVVNSNGLNIKVLGTKFNLKANADDNFIETTLVEGVIEILGLKEDINSQNNLMLQPGQILTLRKENERYEVQSIQEVGLSIPEEMNKPVKIKSANLQEKADVEKATAWTENRLVFVKERFGDVKTKLERWYGVTIEIKDPEISDYRITGTFENQTVEQVMNALSIVDSWTFEINKNHVVVSK